MKQAEDFLNVWNLDVTMLGGPDFVKGMIHQPRPMTRKIGLIYAGAVDGEKWTNG